MGTLSKRRLEDFGFDLKTRLEHFRSHVGKKIDHIADEVEVKSHRSGSIAQRMDKFTAAVAPSTWMSMAGIAAAGSLGLTIAKRTHAAIFVGMFAPTFLVLGLYNKLVKLGADRAASPWIEGRRQPAGAQRRRAKPQGSR